MNIRAVRTVFEQSALDKSSSYKYWINSLPMGLDLEYRL